MSAARTVALLFGVVFLLVGILGFVPGVNDVNHPGAHTGLSVNGPGTGYLLTLFHVNLLHNIVHILFGVLGLAAGRTLGGARGYLQFVAVAYGLLAILGLIPALNINHTFGLIPIEGNDVWLHALIALVAAIFGFAPRRTEGVIVTDTPGTAGPVV
jgi:hypothetical protein